MDDVMEQRVSKIEKRLESIETNTEELLAILRASKSAATAIKWLASVGTAVVGIWAVIHQWPK